MTDTLNTFGRSFQIKLLAAVLTDRNFLMQVLDILDPKYFESESMEWVCSQTLFYFREYRKVPTLDVYKVQVTNVNKELLRAEVIQTIKEIWSNLDAHDLEFVKEKGLEFCKNQEIKKAIFKSVDLLKEGKYDAIKAAIDHAIKAGMNDNLGLDYLVDVDHRYDEKEQKLRIPTGWGPIDNLLKGGLPVGNFGLIMGDKGSGKSFNLVHLGAAALKRGYDVVHYTLELDDEYVAYRYDSTLTGIGLDRLSGNIDDVKRRLSGYDGKLIIKEFPTKSVTLNGIRGHLEKVKLIHGNPKLILVDYLDLLKYGRGSDRDDLDLEALYQEFRGFCKEYDVAGWSVTQSNRTGANKEVSEAESVSGAYAKGFIADFWMSLSRRAKDKLKKIARYNIIKNRYGDDGMVLPSQFDTEYAKIEIFEPNSEFGRSMNRGDKQDDEEYRQLQAERYMKMINGRQLQSQEF